MVAAISSLYCDGVSENSCGARLSRLHLPAEFGDRIPHMVYVVLYLQRFYIYTRPPRRLHHTGDDILRDWDRASRFCPRKSRGLE